jgi:hypothetical protein
MWKLRIGAVVTSGVLVLATSAVAWGASGGDPNAGDVWVDNVGQPPGPGHEMDPHLACSDIALYGAGLADSSGSFAIDGWPPSGSKSVDYSGQWKVQSSTQQIAVIPIAQLMAGAKASADTAAAQGFHFKLDFTQDPQKHKTFWVDCTPSSCGGGGGNNGGGGGNTSGGGGGTTPTTTSPPTTTTTPVKTSIGGATSKRPKAHKKHRRRLRHPARHRKVHRRHVKAIRVVIPEFTG